jgi:hypothetical protein
MGYQQNTEIDKNNIDRKTITATLNIYDELLITPLKDFYSKNNFWSKVWFAIYIIIGLTAVLFSSISAIFTFIEFSNKAILFSVAFCSTASAYVLTFLNPAGRASKRDAAVRKSKSLLTQARKGRTNLDIIPASDSYKKASDLMNQYIELIENYSE